MAVEQSALVAAWYRGSLWLTFLRPLEFLFRALAALRRGLYRWGFKSSWQSPKPVVVVGNITVGGTGKTPVVIALVEYLQANGLNPGVVSRGYGATNGIFPYAVNELSSAADCGDEPLLIYRRTGCPCVVSPARVSAVQHLLANFDVDIVLCDDGLQHYALARDMEIAVLDEERRMGNGWCLPAGPLREPAQRLKEVDYILYRGSEDAESGVPYTAESLVNLSSGESLAISPEQLGEEIYAVAGIGQPSQFFKSLERSGFRVTGHAFADHHKFVAEDFAQLLGKPIIMTEKDAVKCHGLLDTQAWYVRISARLPQAVKQAVLDLAKRGQ
jgi:tetraacyldisaccharide 4'-kinase